MKIAAPLLRTFVIRGLGFRRDMPPPTTNMPSTSKWVVYVQRMISPIHIQYVKVRPGCISGKVPPPMCHIGSAWHE